MSAENPPRAGACENRKVPQGETKRPYCSHGHCCHVHRTGSEEQGLTSGGEGIPAGPCRVAGQKAPTTGRKCGVQRGPARLPKLAPPPPSRPHTLRDPPPLLPLRARKIPRSLRGGYPPTCPSLPRGMRSLSCVLSSWHRVLGRYSVAPDPPAPLCVLSAWDSHKPWPRMGKGRFLKAGPCLSLVPGCDHQDNRRGYRNEEGSGLPTWQPQLGSLSPGGGSSWQSAPSP